jgi:hypothetical protein
VAFVVRQTMPQGSQVTKWAAMRVLLIAIGFSIVCFRVGGNFWIRAHRFQFFLWGPHTIETLLEPKAQ